MEGSGGEAEVKQRWSSDQRSLNTLDGDIRRQWRTGSVPEQQRYCIQGDALVLAGSAAVFPTQENRAQKKKNNTSRSERLRPHMLAAQLRGKINMWGSHSHWNRESRVESDQSSLFDCVEIWNLNPSTCERVEQGGNPWRQRQGCEKGGALPICMCICVSLCCPLFRFNISFISWLFGLEMSIKLEDHNDHKLIAIKPDFTVTTWKCVIACPPPSPPPPPAAHTLHPDFHFRPIFLSVTTIPDVLFPEKLHIPSTVSERHAVLRTRSHHRWSALTKLILSVSWTGDALIKCLSSWWKDTIWTVKPAGVLGAWWMVTCNKQPKKKRLTKNIHANQKERCVMTH